MFLQRLYLAGESGQRSENAQRRVVVEITAEAGSMAEVLLSSTVRTATIYHVQVRIYYQVVFTLHVGGQLLIQYFL